MVAQGKIVKMEFANNVITITMYHLFAIVQKDNTMILKIKVVGNAMHPVKPAMDLNLPIVYHVTLILKVYNFSNYLLHVNVSQELIFLMGIPV